MRGREDGLLVLTTVTFFGGTVVETVVDDVVNVVVMLLIGRVTLVAVVTSKGTWGAGYVKGNLAGAAAALGGTLVDFLADIFVVTGAGAGAGKVGAVTTKGFVVVACFLADAEETEV